MLRVVLLLLASSYVVKSGNVDLTPAIAMYCGKNSQHKDLTTGEWVTDSSGKKDCMDLGEVYEYCRQVYPNLQISNIEQQPTQVRIRSWCALGNPGPICKGHAHAVRPVTCITEDHTPTLVASTGCNVLKISDGDTCMGDSYWTQKASEKCQEDGKVLDDKHSNILPCDVGQWYGIQFACCPSSKPVPKIMNIDPICTQPKKTGVCRAAFDAWYFDVNSGSCQKFTYGGCGGNDNLFYSLKDCQDKCETNALLEDPLLDMGVGPVILDDSSSSTTTASSTPVQTTTTSTQSTSDEQPTESYFNSPLNPNSEPTMYSNALMNELKVHQNKLSSLLNQYNSAKEDLLQKGASQDKGDAVDSDLQKQLAALHNEHQRKREQITSAHQARVDANIVGARTSAFSDLTNELNKPDVQPNKVIRAFHHYIQSETRDQRHTNKLLKHALDQKSPDDADALSSRLSTIKSRVNNALASAKDRLGPGDASDRLNDMAANLLSTSTATTAESPTTSDAFDYDLDEERPRIIDYGGLQPENVDEREEIYEDDDDDNDDEIMISHDEPENDYGGYDHCASHPCVNAYSCWNRIDTYTCLCNEGFTGRNCESETGSDNTFDNYEEDYFSPNTPAPFNPMDFTMPDIDSDFDEEDDIDPLASMQWNQEKYNEQSWLIWVGIAGSCLLVLVLLVAAVRAFGTRYNHRRQFARVEVEEQLTPEERQLLQMQQNGYENPTYKFFEKQQQQQQQA